MTKRKVFDIGELGKTFRIIDGKLEKIDRRMSVPKWKIVENKVDKGTGYCRVWFNGNFCKYHSLLWTLYYNENIPEGLCIDHINGKKDDNRINNLRVLPQRENLQNLEVHRNGKLLGVSYYKRKNQYQSQIKINNKNVHLGYYKTAKESHEAYEIACKHIEEYVDNESFRAIIKNKLYN